MFPSARTSEWLSLEDRVRERRPYGRPEFEVRPEEFLWRPRPPTLKRVRAEIARPSVSSAEELLLDPEAPVHLAEWAGNYRVEADSHPPFVMDHLKGQHSVIPYDARSDCTTPEWRTQFLA